MSVTVLPYTDVATHLASLVCRTSGGSEKIWVLFCYTFLLNAAKLTCMVDSYMQNG